MDRRPEPVLGGATEAFVHERASATPAVTRAREQRKAGAGEAPVLPTGTSLRALEEWFVAAITTPDATAALDEGARRTLTKGPALGAVDRLAVYRDGYRARLVECLADDYPALEYALGHELFVALCEEYVQRHPSSSPNLNSFGRHVARFCAEEATVALPERTFAADLARLEWALVEVLHAGAPSPLSQEALAKIPPEAWTRARLPASNAVRIVRTSFAVNAFFQAFKSDEAPDWAACRREPAATAVYRTDMTLWRMHLTPAMASLLEALFAGQPLGVALETLGSGLAEDEVAEAERNVMAWFRAWVSAGFFARVELE
jgi:hypothetical protein